MRASSQQLLEKAAQDGSWDSEEWPTVLEDVLARLDKIIRTEFPIPILPPEPPPPPQLGSPLGGPSSQDSQTSNKENAPAKTSAPAQRPPVPSFSGDNSQNDDDYPPNYPPDLAAQARSIQKSLKTGHPKYPPHTIQRLADLILEPKKHYRFLPKYLNALDRVVSVQSSTQLFPLPIATLPSSTGMLNGASASPALTRTAPELGSDESLGGALLTPIPWLANRRDSQPSSGSSSGGNSNGNEKELQTSSTEMVEGPNGAGRIETVNVVNGVMTSVSTSPAAGLGSSSNGNQSTEESLRAEGAVTQGELLRQEQEAGVVPVQPRGLRMTDEEMDELTAGNEGGENEDGERPHQTGPAEIGAEDIGAQDRPVGGALDLEAAVGRSRRDSSVDPEDASLSDAGGGREEEMRDADMEDPEKSSAIIDDDAKDAAQPGGSAEGKSGASPEEGK